MIRRYIAVDSWPKAVPTIKIYSKEETVETNMGNMNIEAFVSFTSEDDLEIFINALVLAHGIQTRRKKVEQFREMEIPFSYIVRPKAVE